MWVEDTRVPSTVCSGTTAPGKPAAQQQLAVSLAVIPKMEIIAAYKSGGVIIPAEHIQKVLPGGIQHFSVKGKGDHPGDEPVQQPFPVGGGVDQHRGSTENQCIGMVAEGDCAGIAAGFGGKTAAFL